MATLGIGKTTLWNKIKRKQLPPPFEYCGRHAQWTIGQIRQWRESRAKAITAAAQSEMVETFKYAPSRTKNEFDLF